MAIAKKTDLKYIIDDLSSVLVQSTPIEITKGSGSTPDSIVIAPDYDLPVTVDTLQTSGSEPSITHYKVIGLDTDWTSSTTSGDWTIQFTVPTLHTKVLEFAFGADAINDVTASIGTGAGAGVVEEGDYHGISVTFNKKKVACSLVIVNGTLDRMVIIRKANLWAHVLKEANDDPYAVQFTGTIETVGQDLIVLEKDGQTNLPKKS